MAVKNAEPGMKSGGCLCGFPVLMDVFAMYGVEEIPGHLGIGLFLFRIALCKQSELQGDYGIEPVISPKSA